MPLRRLSRRLLEFINPITVAFPAQPLMTTTVHGPRPTDCGAFLLENLLTEHRLAEAASG